MLGGIVLALAAVMFLRYAIEHELIPPMVRVAIGFATGIAAIAISERLRNREYVAMANALAGSGIVVLYISSWAARVLYELVPPTLGFLLMILVTVACGALAWRHKAREVALLGRVGRQVVELDAVAIRGRVAGVAIKEPRHGPVDPPAQVASHREAVHADALTGRRARVEPEELPLAAEQQWRLPTRFFGAPTPCPHHGPWHQFP